MLKKILKKIYISKPISFLANVFGPLCKGKGAILMYHRILPEKFIKQDMNEHTDLQECEDRLKQIFGDRLDNETIVEDIS